MKKALIALLFIAGIATAQNPPPITYTIEADYQQAQSLPNQSFQQGAGVRLRYKLMSNGSYLSLTGLTGKWQGRSSITSTNYITQTTATTVTNATPNYFQFDIDSTATGSSVTNWVYSMIATYNSNDYVLGTGRLDIVASAWTGDGATISADSNVNSLIAGTGITLSPTNGIGTVTITAQNNGDITGVVAGTGLTGFGTSGTVTGSLSAASIASLALADTATQPGDDWTNTIASMSAADVTNGATLGATALQSESDTLATVLVRGNDGNALAITNISQLVVDGTGSTDGIKIDHAGSGVALNIVNGGSGAFITVNTDDFVVANNGAVTIANGRLTLGEHLRIANATPQASLADTDTTWEFIWDVSGDELSLNDYTEDGGLSSFPVWDFTRAGGWVWSVPQTLGGAIDAADNSVTGLASITFTTNTTIQTTGTLNGTNGVYWTVNNTNWWILFSE